MHRGSGYFGTFMYTTLRTNSLPHYLTNRHIPPALSDCNSDDDDDTGNKLRIGGKLIGRK
ncbi:hypothetical protein J6590_002829 [Homalodisca vitripennis]|nr:hypothetical protein J6590_002829 [Homalodisca vitripennis]